MSPNFAALLALLHDGVREGRIAGAVALAEHAGQRLHLESTGWLDASRSQTMPLDARFWIASMTKPVTTVAALTLVEQGHLQLSDAVTAHLPELHNQRLVDGSEPPSPMTVLDLMRHTTGLTYGFMGGDAVRSAYVQAKAIDYSQSNADMVSKLARLPLLHEPGTVFEYSMATDVLGRVVEACTGQPLGEVMRERIFAPLGMESTGFEVRSDAAHLIARPLPHESFDLAPPPQGARWQSGGAGLWSTARDYAHFARMLLDDGCFEGRQVLQASTVRQMRKNHLPEAVHYGEHTENLGSVAPLPKNGRGFGLGLSVRLRDAAGQPPGHVGDFSWPGFSGTNFWCDPATGQVVVVMMQAPSQRLYYRDAARHAVYAEKS